MATSQNGWPAGSRAEAGVATFPVPGYPNVKLPINREAAPALLAMARWFFDHVEPPVMPGCWGWADRKIRGSATQVSNHASGTAIDLNAPRHPLGAVGTVPERLRPAIAAAAAKYGLRWGGTYTGRKDEMHFEVIVGKARMQQIVHALQHPTPSSHQTKPAAGARPTIQVGSTHPLYVKDVQRRLRSNYPSYAKGVVVDGVFGAKTEAAVKEFQRRSHLASDGIVGPATWKALGF
jgi:hypothetical protein